MAEPYPFLQELADQCGLDGFGNDYAGEFLRPRRDVWPASPDRFMPLVAKILSALPEERQRLFRCFLLGCHLLDPEKTPVQAITFLESAPEGDIPPILHDRQLWRTAVVPLPLLESDGKGALRYAIIGCRGTGPGGPIFPEEIGLLLDDDALSAATTAITLASRNRPEISCLFWPILYPHPTTDHQIKQGSIALPLYLAFDSLLSGESLPPLLATGALDSQGRLLRVDGVREKFGVVRKAECRGFICPAEQGRDPLAGLHDGDIDIIAAETTEDALLFWNCYRVGEGKQLREIIADLETPGHLLESLPDHPVALSDLPAPLRRRITEAVGRLLQDDPHRGSGSLQHFARKLEDTKRDPQHAYRLVSLISREMVEQVGKSYPEAGLQLALLHLDISGRRGEDALSGQTWSRLADGFRQARSNHSDTDEPDQVCIGIREFMSTRHNAYRFDPAEADGFLERISLPLAELRERFQRKRSRNPEQTDKTVGSCLGLLAQHYAFCGDHEKAADFSAQALGVFGHGSASPLERDCRQQLIYRTYIALDAGDFLAARDILCGLLGVTDPDDLIPAEMTEPYLHAALARYMADSGEIFNGYLEYALKILPHCEQQHPWQLWCHNIGSCSPQDEQVRFYRASLERCRRPGQPTIQVMALLPLAALWKREGASEDELSSGVREVCEVIARDAVDQDHFRSVMTVTGWKEVLRVVEQEKARLFPFNYR